LSGIGRELFRIPDEDPIEEGSVDIGAELARVQQQLAAAGFTDMPIRLFYGTVPN
jgi:hypothetical protein